jgi:hypothetical protein
MQYLDNILSEDDIAVFRSYWDKNNDQSYINGTTGDSNPAKAFSKYQDKRLLIANGTKSYAILRRIVDSLFPKDTHFWANYQRQTAPPQLHVDEYGRDRDNPTWTIILALDTVPEFKAIVFKELANECVEAFNIPAGRIQSGMPRISNISETEALDHAPYGDLNLCDWLTVDGIFQYKAGCGCLFDTNQLHITNYWRRYTQYEYRDLVQLHIGQPKYAGDVAEERRNGDPIPEERDLKIVD